VLLFTSTQPQDKVKRRFLLDVVISQRATILQLLAGEDQTLLVWGAFPPEPFRTGLDYTLSYLKTAMSIIDNRKPSSL
jgi:hypothetical protein